MILKRYLIELLPEQLLSLPPEHLELATRIQGARGEELLLYRDSLVAYKVATLTGGTVRYGQVVLGTTPLAGTLALGDGRQLLLETPASA